MQVKIAITDLRTDGTLPIDCEMSVNNDRLKLKADSLDLEIGIPLYYLGMLLGGEEHG